jgi:flagellar motor switch protein FliG
MEIDVARVRELIGRLKGLSEEAREDELARLAQSDAAFYEEVRTLVAAVRAADAAPTESDLPRETILAAATTPRIRHLANALDGMVPSLATDLMERIARRSPGLAEALKAAMFTFDDLIHVDNRGLQKLIHTADKKTLRYAMRGASNEVASRVYSQMSRRAAADLREDIEAMGPKRRSELEHAQREIADLGRRLEKAGKLILRRPGSSSKYV